MSLGTYKVVLLGEGRVGKTSIASRFVDDTFDSGQISTVQANMYSKKRIPVEGTLEASRAGEKSKGRKYVDIALWDTAGQERYHALGPIYYRNANGAVLVYDITDADTFERIRMWIKELRQVVGDNIHIVICGNKSDLESDREVNLAMAEKFARAQGASHFSTSAKTNEGVGEAFQCLVQKILASLGLVSPDGAPASPGGDGEGEDEDENDANGDDFPTLGGKKGGSKSKKASTPTTKRGGVRIALDDDEAAAAAPPVEEETSRKKTKKGGAKIADDEATGGTARAAGGFGYDDYGSYGNYHSQVGGSSSAGASPADDGAGSDKEGFISGDGTKGKNSSAKAAPPAAPRPAASTAASPPQPSAKSQPITLDDKGKKGGKKEKKDKDCGC